MIDITNNSDFSSFDVDIVYQAVFTTLAAHDDENKEVSVLLTDDSLMTEMNRDYRGINSPTDVLAFSQLEGEDSDFIDSDLLGDVVISMDTAERQAQKTEHSLEKEVALLTIHGVLHLLGYDHQRDEDATIMFEKQQSILSSII